MPPKKIPLNFVTMYADLAQNAGPSTLDHGSVVSRSRRGREYLYSVSKDGGERREVYLGPADDAEAAEKAAHLRQAALQARDRRSTVSALKRSGIPAPSLYLGNVLEVIANAGLFQRGAMLVGTAAYQTYACPLGYFLPGSSVMTNDADLLVASLVTNGLQTDLEQVLQKADPTFKAVWANEDRLPKVFRSANNFSVDIVTKYGRNRKSPMPVPGLGCSAEALRFMEYLAQDSMEAVALYGTGVLIRVPPPARYAMHKLLIARERSGKFLSKKQKDLDQARYLIGILKEVDPAGLTDALDDVRSRGRTWKQAINGSLRDIACDL